jgi:hypothetical protein
MWIEKTMEPRLGLRNEGTKEDMESVQSMTKELVSTGDGPGSEKIELRRRRREELTFSSERLFSISFTFACQGETFTFACQGEKEDFDLRRN